MSEKEKARLRIEQYKQHLKAGNQTPRNKQPPNQLPTASPKLVKATLVHATPIETQSIQPSTTQLAKPAKLKVTKKPFFSHSNTFSLVIALVPIATFLFHENCSRYRLLLTNITANAFNVINNAVELM